MKYLAALIAFLLVTTPALAAEKDDYSVENDYSMGLGMSLSPKWAAEVVRQWRMLPRKNCGQARVIVRRSSFEGWDDVYHPIVNSWPVTNVECARSFYRRWLGERTRENYPEQTFHCLWFKPPEKYKKYPDENNDP